MNVFLFRNTLFYLTIYFQPQTRVQSGYCMRIATGAPVPIGADAVIQVEDTVLLQQTDDGKEEVEISITKPPSVGQDIR